MKRSAVKLIFLGLAAVLLSATSGVIARAAGGGWALHFGPSGIVGGWPVSFIEYDFSDFFRNCTDCAFTTPPGSFLILNLEANYNVGEFYYGYFIANTLFWVVLAFTALLLAKVIQKAVGKFNTQKNKQA